MMIELHTQVMTRLGGQVPSSGARANKCVLLCSGRQSYIIIMALSNLTCSFGGEVRNHKCGQKRRLRHCLGVQESQCDRALLVFIGMFCSLA